MVLFVCAPGVAPAATWLEQSPSGTPPIPRWGQNATAYDTTNDRLILFSGDDGDGLPRPTDTWVLAGATSGSPSWTQLAPTGTPPPGVLFHTVVYSPSSNRIIVFGGCASNCGLALSGVWVLTNANGIGGTPAWSQLAPSGAFNSEGHSAVYDDASNRMISFGGQQGFNSPWNTVRVLTNADGLGGAPAWATLSPSGTSPSAREAVGAAYDPTTNRMMVFGGATLACCATITAMYNDVWVLTDANGVGTPSWTQLTPSGTPPSPRAYTTAVYDADENRLIVFGGVHQVGASPSTEYNDVWVLSNANGLGGTPAWTQLAPTGGPPAARSAYVAAYSTASNAMVLTTGRGGAPGVTLFNDVWLLQEDGTPPAISITTPADGASYILGSTVLADYECKDEAGGSGLASCLGTVANGSAIDTATTGPKTFTVDAEDDAGNAASLTHDYSVVYDFSGFFSPVNNMPVLNAAKAGQGIPVKFSLAGDQGLNIFAAGYPKSEQTSCSSTAEVDGIESTVTAGSSSLSYDAATDRYTYVWKTLKTWAGTCRQLVVKLSDGSSHRANFIFK